MTSFVRKHLIARSKNFRESYDAEKAIDIDDSYRGLALDEQKQFVLYDCDVEPRYQYADLFVVEHVGSWSVFMMYWPCVAIYALVGKE